MRRLQLHEQLSLISDHYLYYFDYVKIKLYLSVFNNKTLRMKNMLNNVPLKTFPIYCENNTNENGCFNNLSPTVLHIYTCVINVSS